MKNKLLIGLLHLALVLPATAMAAPVTTIQNGNTTLHVSGPVFGSVGGGSVVGSDAAAGVDTGVRPNAPDAAPIPLPVVIPTVPPPAAPPVVTPVDVPTIPRDVISAVPEPSALLLAALGLAGLGVRLRRRVK